MDDSSLQMKGLVGGMAFKHCGAKDLWLLAQS